MVLLTLFCIRLEKQNCLGDPKKCLTSQRKNVPFSRQDHLCLGFIVFMLVVGCDFFQALLCFSQCFTAARNEGSAIHLKHMEIVRTGHSTVHSTCSFIASMRMSMTKGAARSHCGITCLVTMAEGPLHLSIDFH